VKPSCRIVSSEYLDRDVYLNVRCLYAAAGYRLQGRGGADPDLLVVLRGDQGTADRDYAGPIHLYDYVKEYRVDWAARYPASRAITWISLDQPGAIADPRLRHLCGYLPVFAELWRCRTRRRRQRPVHVANYKRIPGDAFQEQLLGLIRSGLVEVHGGRWQTVGVSARPLSYLQANRLIAGRASCFGLMWPYQRGRTLSGRMWQAPLNGCFVFAEPGSDPLGCPGVLMLERFDEQAATLIFAPEEGEALARQAAAFWRSHTEALAAGLGLDPAAARPGPWRIHRLRLELLRWDLGFRLQRWQGRVAAPLAGAAAAVRQALARLARALGVHPAQRRGGDPHQ